MRQSRVHNHLVGVIGVVVVVVVVVLGLWAFFIFICARRHRLQALGRQARRVEHPNGRLGMSYPRRSVLKEPMKGMQFNKAHLLEKDGFSISEVAKYIFQTFRNPGIASLCRQVRNLGSAILCTPSCFTYQSDQWRDTTSGRERQRSP